ncbi:MAG: LexA family transcriptional regulator [Bacteroidetes bacterium]|nr:LexA family transcriptional regulator [Bacteroidota bacterium]
MNEVTERFIECYKYLEKLNFFSNKKEFAKIIGVSTSLLTDIEKERSNIGINAIRNTVINFNINSDWILTGNGSMIKGIIPIAKKTENLKEGIPLITTNAMAGYFKGDTQVLEYECERFVVPIFKDAEFLISVRGSSMNPKYNSGDIVACKKLTIDTFFQWNKVYVLDTIQGALIKRVKKGSTDDYLLIVSDNPKYEAFELPKTSIYGIAIVIGVIRLE